MLTRRNLDDVQAQFSQVSNLVCALDILVDGIDESCAGPRRRQLDAIIGVRDAIISQMEAAQGGFDALFPLLLEGGAA